MSDPGEVALLERALAALVSLSVFFDHSKLDVVSVTLNDLLRQIDAGQR